MQFTSIPRTETKPETQIPNNVVRTVSSADPSTKPSLTRSKSMEVLPRQRTVSTSSLRELFESRNKDHIKVARKPKSILKKRKSHENGDIRKQEKRSEDVMMDVETDATEKPREDTVTTKVTKDHKKLLQTVDPVLYMNIIISKLLFT